jgi:phage recombination protein Bet
MSNIIPLTKAFRESQIQLIQRMNPDCNATEFDQFLHVAAQMGLDPLRKQIYAFVFSKDKPDRRRMSIVVGIDGFRAVAKRSGEYRPDNRAPRFVTDPEAVDEASNPLGLVSCEVSVFQYSHNEWHEVAAIAYWSEFAPIVEGGKWVNGEDGRRSFRKDGTMTLDPNKDNWRKMPRVMLAKCAEAQAIRRAWPEDLSAIYADEELDRAKTLDLTATEIVEKAKAEDRLALIGGADAVFFDMGDGLERVPIKKAADMLLERFRTMKRLASSNTLNRPRRTWRNDLFPSRHLPCIRQRLCGAHRTLSPIMRGPGCDCAPGIGGASRPDRRR